MRTINFAEFCADSARTFDSVVDDREEVIVTRSRRRSVAIVALDDYLALRESAHVLRSPENAVRLLRSIERLEAGGGLIEG